MGLDMHLERFPRIEGWTAKQYDQVSDAVYQAGTEKRVEGNITRVYYTGIKQAIDFASLLDFVQPVDNKILNEAIREVPVGQHSFFRFGEEVGYWRKANAIHQWFVANVQNGEDDCESYEVTPMILGKLNNVVQQVLDDRSLAMKLLPPSSGFFFGSTDINDWYWSDLEDTVNTITKILEETDWDTQVVTYRASW